MMIVYDKSYASVSTGGSVEVDMDNISKMLVAKDVANVSTTLTKTFNSTGWNSLVLPFDLTVTTDMLNKFDFATLYAVTLENGNGSTVIAFREAKANTEIKAYSPCLIRAKTTGKQQIITAGSVTYKKSADAKTADCSSITELYTFYPVMENTYLAEKNGYYLDPATNSFRYNKNAGAYMQPLKFYMTIQNRSDNSYILPSDANASETKFTVIGFDEATGITNVEGEAATETGKVYNMQGVVVGHSLKNLPKGVYIWNGRKVVVR